MPKLAAAGARPPPKTEGAPSKAYAQTHLNTLRDLNWKMTITATHLLQSGTDIRTLQRLGVRPKKFRLSPTENSGYLLP